MAVDDLSYKVIGAAMSVHRHFGPGFLEEVYKNALMVELERLRLPAVKETPIPIDYCGVRVGNYQADIIVADCLIVELKAVSMLLPRHEAQLVNYLCATHIDDGLLVNFGADKLQYKHKYRQLATPVNLVKDTPETIHPVNPV